ncbi:polysaccharide deacetylase family protein [Bacteroidota bacterium]
MNYFKPSALVKSLYGPNLIWSVKDKMNTVYLTFDDGPIPEVTPLVLDILDKYNVKATFFCVGHNVFKNPEVYQQILQKGHKTANHTYNHLKGWKTTLQKYTDNVAKCAEFVDSDFFRPPYGRITRKQSKLLRRDYKIIMWTVLSGDYSSKTTKEQCLENALNIDGKGSIVIFHDSIKAKEKVMFALPGFIEGCLERGYAFELID